MSIGDRIKKARVFRGMTQKELGVAVGFNKRGADVRIAQYESNTRKPKDALLHKIADVLDVSFYALYEPDMYCAEDVMYTLFDQDDQHPGIRLVDVLDDSGSQQPKKRIAIIYDYDRMEDYLGEWKLRKEQLANGEITQEEYTEWRLNWPATADACYPDHPLRLCHHDGDQTCACRNPGSEPRRGDTENDFPFCRQRVFRTLQDDR